MDRNGNSAVPCVGRQIPLSRAIARGTARNQREWSPSLNDPGQHEARADVPAARVREGSGRILLWGTEPHRPPHTQTSAYTFAAHRESRPRQDQAEVEAKGGESRHDTVYWLAAGLSRPAS